MWRLTLKLLIAACDSQAIGLASGGKIQDDSFSASSIYNSRYQAKFGRLNGPKARGKRKKGKEKLDSFVKIQISLYIVHLFMFISVPSQPPTAFKATASSSTSITASWQLPAVFARHGRNITGFKLFYKKKGSGGSATTLAISSGSIKSRTCRWAW